MMKLQKVAGTPKEFRITVRGCAEKALPREGGFVLKTALKGLHIHLLLLDFAQPIQGCRLWVSLPGVGAKRANPGLCTEAPSGLSPTEIRRCGTFCRAIFPNNLAKSRYFLLFCRPLRDLRVYRTGRNSGDRTVVLRPCLVRPCIIRHRTVIPRHSPVRDGKILARQFIAGLAPARGKSHRDGRTGRKNDFLRSHLS